MRNFIEIEKAKQLLKDNGYFIDNLWCENDVRGEFECTSEQAQKVLGKALTNDATMEQIWLAIGMFGEMENLIPVNEE